MNERGDCRLSPEATALFNRLWNGATNWAVILPAKLAGRVL